MQKNELGSGTVAGVNVTSAIRGSAVVKKRGPKLNSPQGWKIPVWVSLIPFPEAKGDTNGAFTEINAQVALLSMPVMSSCILNASLTSASEEPVIGSCDITAPPNGVV